VFVVPSGAPNVLYYHCGTHSGMGGKIEIYDDGQILIIDDVTSGGQWGVTVKDTGESTEQRWDSWMGDNLTTTTSTFGRISGYSLFYNATSQENEPVRAHYELFDEFQQWIDLWMLGGVSMNETTGTFMLDVPAGTYYLQARPEEAAFAPIWYDGKSTYDTATPIVVTDGGIVSGIRFAYTKLPVGTISGTILSSTGDIINEAEIAAYKQNTDGSYNPWPDIHMHLSTPHNEGETGDINSTTGAYEKNIPTGTYKLRLKIWGDPNQQNYTPYEAQYYDGVTSKSAATGLTIQEGVTITGVNFTPAPSKFGVITGVVSDESGVPFTDWPYVDLFTIPSDGSKLTHENQWDYWAETISNNFDDVTGTYTINVAAGSYYLQVGGNSGGTNYRGQFY